MNTTEFVHHLESGFLDLICGAPSVIGQFFFFSTLCFPFFQTRERLQQSTQGFNHRLSCFVFWGARGGCLSKA